MSCTPRSRPSGKYYVSLTLSIISLAVFTSLGMYVAETRSQLTTLSYTVSSHDARISAIPDYVYEMDKDLNAIAPAAGETSPPPRHKKRIIPSCPQRCHLADVRRKQPGRQVNRVCLLGSGALGGERNLHP